MTWFLIPSLSCKINVIHLKVQTTTTANFYSVCQGNCAKLAHKAKIIFWDFAFITGLTVHSHGKLIDNQKPLARAGCGYMIYVSNH